jgi:transaldolase
MELWSMKMFLDTGDVEAIKKAYDTGLVRFEADREKVGK